MDKPKILIVDDEQFFTNLLKELLAPEYQTEVAHGGKEAIACLANEPLPDLILLDILMPGMDGYAVCEKIKAIPVARDIPIIFLTIKSEVKDEIRGFKLGGVDYITKPISPPIVKARIKNHLELKQARENAIKDARHLESLVDQKTRELYEKIAERQKAVEQLHYMANYDALTNLPNRVMFKERLNQLCEQAARNELGVGLLLFDLDRFKHVNDTLGHHKGDELLIQVAGRLRKFCRVMDAMARLGGDEFAIALSESKHRDDVAAVARKVISELNRPFELDERSIHIGASVGITLFPDDSDDLGTLLQNADMAMYKAKSKGKNTYEFFTSDLTTAMKWYLQMDADLRKGVAAIDEQFQLHYQPLIELPSGRIVGAEALLRWQHPRQGMIPPKDFVSIAEDTGLIVNLGEWVLATACRQAQSWLCAGWDDLFISVNLSSRQFGYKTDILATVDKILEETRLPPERLKPEITESLMMENLGDAIGKLQALSQKGIHIAVDDFGTGYSSLSYIRQLPLDCLKIDKSFIGDITTDSDDAALVAGIIALAKNLQLTVVAEGVETGAQLQFLKDQECHMAQGYLISRALPADQFEEMVKSFPN